MSDLASEHLGFQPAIKALVAAFEVLPQLAGFTISDRPPSRRDLPNLRLGPVQQEPWSTNSSVGSRLDISLTLTSRNGSFAPLGSASDAILERIAGSALSLSQGTCVVQSAGLVRFDHGAGQNLELATLTITLLLDLGDAP